jgi:alanine racemase
MADRPPASLRLAIDGDALAANWRALDRLSGEARAGAAVKADCYGLGVDLCLPVLSRAGARDFFVAHWSEVEPIAAHVPADSIAVLHGVSDAQDVAYARATGARPVINSPRQAQLWLDQGGGSCHLMVDTGINRLGAAMGELGDPALAALEVDALLSHLACADEDSDYNGWQRERFDEARRAINHRQASLANSAGIALGPAYGYDLTRPGLALYGGVPRSELSAVVRQVVYPQAAVLQRRRLAPGERVGYNGRFTASRAMEVATVSAGYADGFLRSRAGGHVTFEGGELPVLGTVSMDMIVVDVSARPAIREGDWVSLPYDLPAAAGATGLSQYELLTTLGHRFDRCYR